MSFDPDALSLAELIRLQDQLSQVLKRRFERPLALVFTDIVGSTTYFATFGDEAGRGLQQRHFDLLQQVLPARGGRVVDTAGDGAFVSFGSVEAAAAAVVELQTLISRENIGRSREHQLSVRIGIHWGSVLTDGEVVTGDAVNLASRVTASANGSEIRLTKSAFLELTNVDRLRCGALPPTILKGIPQPVEMMVFEWRDRTLYPASFRVEETGEEIPLPALDTISFGRLKENNGVQLNDVVLALPNLDHQKLISRWHFELRRHSDGFRLRPVSDQPTEVDGKLALKGQDVPIKPGSVVRVSRVMTLRFLGDRRGPFAAGDDASRDATLSLEVPQS